MHLRLVPNQIFSALLMPSHCYDVRVLDSDLQEFKVNDLEFQEALDPDLTQGLTEFEAVAETEVITRADAMINLRDNDQGKLRETVLPILERDVRKTAR